MRTDRLLRTLHRTYRPGRRVYEKEDLFSEYLAWLLNRSQRFRVAFAELALHDSADVDPDVFGEAEAETQVSTRRGGQVDLILRVDVEEDREGALREAGNTALLAIECKVDSGFGSDQLKRYHRWLEDEAGRYRRLALAALTKRKLGRQPLLDRQEYPYWMGNMYWYKVAEALERSVEEVRAKRLPSIDPEGDDFLEPAGFVVIGDEFQDLMGVEGMVATSRLDAENAADMYRDYHAYRERFDDILHLVERAIDATGIRELLRKKADADNLRTEHKKPFKKGRPISRIHHREDPPACFIFGVTVSPPNRYARKRTETFRPEEYEAELIAGYQLLDDSEGGLSWPREELEEIAETVRAAAGDCEDDDLAIFVPENASYQKWVARAPVPAVGNADEQVAKIGRFYQTFVSALLTAEGPDGQPMITYLRHLHRGAVSEE